MRKLMISALVALGVMFYWPPGDAKASHNAVSHTIVACKSERAILSLFQTALSSRPDLRAYPPGECRSLNQNVTDDTGFVQLAATAKDWEGDTFAPFRYTMNGGTVYVIIYFGKGQTSILGRGASWNPLQGPA